MTLSRTSLYPTALSIPNHSENALTLPSHGNVSRKLPDILIRQAPATCGELMQGAIDGRDFLVNCPIDLYAQATLLPTGSSGLVVRDATRYTKVAHAIALLDACAEQQTPRDVVMERSAAGRELVVTSRIPRGKGMASSSADLAAALSVACELRGLNLSAVELSRLIARVEPSDSVHLPGIGHVNHLNGVVHACLPAPEDLSVIVLDCGGEVDTLAFDREKARSVYHQAQARVTATLALMCNSLRLGDPVGIALAATISARLSQQILPKAPFDELLDSCTRDGALGVNCAHSGTVLGVLYRTSDDLGDALIDSIRRRFGSDLTLIGNHRIVSGGCHAR
ncbi:GHMP family kinase ATP-binding protein [Granulosicoccus sp. 3-233]|uniref:GHMP family kinase ATP-binding protein n=1 Tax=Granulosicoccus sp. 3-233 TaxID=3417969 RepID=UPI003D339033